MWDSMSILGGPGVLDWRLVPEWGQIGDRGQGQGQRLRVRGQEVRGQRSEVNRLEVERSELELESEHCIPEECYRKEPDFAKGSVESNQVIDSIFELRIIHVREAAYK
jgi:hypothetical protein